MNVFEDLIIELKEENLLEQTVIDGSHVASSDVFELEVTAIPNKSFEPASSVQVETESSVDYRVEVAPVEASPSQTGASVDAAQHSAEPSPQNLRQRQNKEFFTKRAAAEVSSLQMVEHVLTGVEREHMKVVPKTYDDFKAKKALNSFLQVAQGVNSEGHAGAEFELMQETESWCSALAERDKNVPVSSLRQYCENTKPALSSQALLSVARFYRNLPFSEAVRAKFDFVMTRLFSRPDEHEKRVCLFSLDETLSHIKSLYADWSSIPLYAADDDDSSVMLAALSFEDLAVEAENTSNFDHLIKSDFFGRMRLFKESISETFFAPTVTASAVEANVRIGNAYVALISRERQKMDAESIQSKYGSVNDLAVSDATGRTMDLLDILSAPAEPVVEEFGNLPAQAEHLGADETAAAVEVDPRPVARKKPGEFVQRIRAQIFSVNKWILIVSGLLIAASVALAAWSNLASGPSVSSSGVASVTFENAAIQQHVEKAKVSNGLLYVQLKGTWDALPKEKRQEILQTIHQEGAAKGYDQVNLISKEGKMIGYASATRLDVVMP